MAHKKPTSLSGEMRHLLATCGESRYSIWKATGLTQSMLSRFQSGGGITLKHIDTLASHLGWTVQQQTTDGE